MRHLKRNLQHYITGFSENVQEIFRRLSGLGINDLPAHIKFEVCYTPLSWRKHYNLLKGATHGLCHNLAQLGYFRPANRHARYPNLYFAGELLDLNGPVGGYNFQAAFSTGFVAGSLV